jgi:hypothetical protein
MSLIHYIDLNIIFNKFKTFVKQIFSYCNLTLLYPLLKHLLEVLSEIIEVTAFHNAYIFLNTRYFVDLIYIYEKSA